MGERLGIAAEHDVDVAQVAVDANAFGGGNHEVGRRRALLLGSVFRVGADVDDLLGFAELVDDLVAVVEQIVEVADDGAEVLAGRDGAPAADGMEADGDRLVGQQRRRVVDFTSCG